MCSDVLGLWLGVVRMSLGPVRTQFAVQLPQGTAITAVLAAIMASHSHRDLSLRLTTDISC